jgi:hypothetical protein
VPSKTARGQTPCEAPHGSTDVRGLPQLVRSALVARADCPDTGSSVPQRPWIPHVNRDHLQLHLCSACGRAQA